MTEEIVLSKKTQRSINSGHKTAAAIDKFDESNNGMFLPLLLSSLTFGACFLSGEGLPFRNVPSFSGGVCAFELYLF